jgi:DNA polymerase I
VRLTKSPDEYLAARANRRELPYEALLTAGHTSWDVGDRIRVYRKRNGEGGLAGDLRDYDIEYYVRLLRTTYAERLARAFTPEDFATVFADADQFSLFTPAIESIHTVLTPLGGIRQHEQVQAGDQERGERKQRQQPNPDGLFLL